MEMISVAKVEALRAKLLVEALPLYLGTFLAGDAFSQFVTDVYHTLGVHYNKKAVVDSLRSLAGLEFNSARMDELAWRLAGNAHRIKNGVAVPPWRGQTEAEWVPAEIIRVVKESRTFKASTPEQAVKADAKGRVHRRGARIWMRFLGGLPAGREEEQFWSVDYCQASRKAMGFDRFNKIRNARHFSRKTQYLFIDVRELYGRRFYAYLNPELSRYGELAIGEIKGTAASIKHNRDLHKLRLRIEHACPKDYDDSVDCFACHVGRDQCPAACHATTFVDGYCSSCHKNSYFDADYSSDVCVDC